MRLGATALLVAISTSACMQSTDGAAVAESPAPRAPSPAPTTTVATPTTSVQSNEPPPGIMPTNRTPIPPNSVTCGPEARPAVTAVATVADPAAPRVTVGVPDGWSSTLGSGDVGVRLTGPDGMAAVVSITPTTLDAEAAFRAYTDELLEKSAISSVSILPAQLCDYSGQKLIGAWSDTPENSVEFRDRVVHVWTNAGNYLVALHVEAQTGVGSLADASSVITDDLEVTIP